MWTLGRNGLRSGGTQVGKRSITTTYAARLKSYTERDQAVHMVPEFTVLAQPPEWLELQGLAY